LPGKKIAFRLEGYLMPGVGLGGRNIKRSKKIKALAF